MAGISSDVADLIGVAEGQELAASDPYGGHGSYEGVNEFAAETYPEQVTAGPEEAFNLLAYPLDLPPEVIAALGPGVNPFASLIGGTTVTPTTPTGVGLAPGVPALAPAPYPNTIVVSTQPITSGVFPGQVFPALVEWPLGVFELGKIVFEHIENRQAGGVRFGTLPMVVFQDNSGRGGF